MRIKRTKYLTSLLVCIYSVALASSSASHTSAHMLSQSNEQTPAIDTALAEQYFQEAQNICRADDGRLWGVSLCAPILFVDLKTRSIVANQMDAENRLSKEKNVFTGHLPERVNVANTALDWSGTKWAMIIWPLPENRNERASLLAHESWHRIQNALNLPASMPANAHLDSMQGRLWLQLEWRALAVALTKQGEARRAAARDALVFRAYRRILFPEAQAEERALEMNEGLAEYTGVKLSNWPNVAQRLAAQLKAAEHRETFVRSFAYASVPAYGILLDEAGTAKASQASWRKTLRSSDDFGLLLQQTLTINLPPNIKQEAESAAGIYDGDALLSLEHDRERKRQQRLAPYRASLIDGAVLILPLRKMNMQFNPNNPVPLDGRGTLYPDIRVVDVWGVLAVTKGALMNPTFTEIRIPAPREPDTQAGLQTLHGDGWTLDLNAGWTIKPGARIGDYVLQQSVIK